MHAGCWVIMASMSTVMIVLILLVVTVIVVSLVLGRLSYQVESARDTEYVELEGHWIRYNVIGGGPPVLLVHGWLSSSRIWEQLARRLAQRFTVYTLDLTGFGDSDKPTEGYGTRHGSRLLYAFCAHFGLARATVIGHDFGGVMAMKLAADHPDIVGRLVLVSTPADEEQIDLPTLLWLTTLPVVGPVYYALGRLLRPVRRLWVRPFVFDPRDLPEELVDDVGKSTPAALSKTLNITRQEIADGRVARQARIVKVPILLVAGEDDQIMDPRAVSDWGQNAEQAEIVLLDRCGHLPMVELPSEFSARVLAFLTGDSRYLEYVKEVPAPVEPSATDEGEEEELAAEPERIEEPKEEPVHKEESLQPGAGSSFGDISWDFSPGRPSPSRKDRPATPRPGSDREVDESRPRSPVSRPSTPQADEIEAEYGPQEKDEETSPRPRRQTDRTEDREPASGRIPEFPGDLFQWSETPGEYSPGRRSRRRRASGDQDGERG